MIVACVRQGYEEPRLLDMDIVSFAALYGEIVRQELLEAASEVSRSAVAAQGDSKGIKKFIKDLHKAAGEKPDTSKGLTDLMSDHG